MSSLKKGRLASLPNKTVIVSTQGAPEQPFEFFDYQRPLIEQLTASKVTEEETANGYRKRVWVKPGSCGKAELKLPIKPKRYGS